MSKSFFDRQEKYRQNQSYNAIFQKNISKNDKCRKAIYLIAFLKKKKPGKTNYQT